MGTIYGPYDAADWFVMKQLRESVAWMSSRDYGKYRTSIEKEQELFGMFVRKEVA